MADEPLATVPDKPVRVKISYPDGSWAKATLGRVPHESEITEGETYEILDEPGHDIYDLVIPTEYGEATKTAKKAASSKEADK